MLKALAAQWSNQLQAETGEEQAVWGVRLGKQFGVIEAPSCEGTGSHERWRGRGTGLSPAAR